MSTVLMVPRLGTNSPVRAEPGNELIERHARLELALEASHLGVWEWNLVTGEYFPSPRWKQLLGYEEHELPNPGTLFFERLHPEDEPMVRQAVRTHCEERRPYEMEVRLRCKDGAYRWFLSRGCAQWDEQGKPLHMVFVVSDITASKCAQEALRNSLGTLQAILNASSDGYWGVDRQGQLLEVNRAYCRQSGYSQEELLTMRITDLDVAESAEATAEHLQQIIETGTSQFETMHRRKDGSVWYVEVTANYIDTAEGKLFAFCRDITKRKVAEVVRHDGHMDAIRGIVETAFDGYLRVGCQGQLLDVNSIYCQQSGFSREELRGMSLSDLTHDAHGAIDGHLEFIIKHGHLQFETMHRRKGGVTWHLEVSATYHTVAEGQIFAFVRDITERKLSEQALRIAATAFDAQEAMVVTDSNWIILRANRAYIESSGYSAEELVGQNVRILKSCHHNEAFYHAMWASIDRTGVWQGEVWGQRKNGEKYPKWLTISAVKALDGVVTHYVSTHHDITERKLAEEKIRDLAFFDPLTHLHNRTLLMDRSRQAMIIGDRNGTFGAMLFIDLDHFKTINDTLGHDKGDQLLQHVAQRLLSSVRAGDTVARLGGDEFVVMLCSLSGSGEEAAVQAEGVARKILLALSEPYQLEGINYHSTASIGATLFHGHETVIDDVLRQADLAMYKSKSSGRNTLRFFDPAMHTAVMEKAALNDDLRQAVSLGQFMLHYQAQVAHGGQVTGCEALVRWQHPVRGLISPADFIPLAEELGLILPLGHWVLECACAQLTRWASQREFKHLTVSVNVSALQFQQDDFVAEVLGVLQRTGASPHRLKLELTESLLVDNVPEIIKKMTALKQQGVSFSLDDFGTGYSSLGYLKLLPLDELKIDQSFVRDILIDANDAAIARTIVALARSLGLGVIAEGVETLAQRDLLASQGCLAYQGYFFSRPLPIDAFEAWARPV